MTEVALRRIYFDGRQACCGATNHCCALPPGVVEDYGTGCEKCGHDPSCHAFWWTTP